MKVIHILTDTNFGGAGRYVLTLLDNCRRVETGIRQEVIIPKYSLLKPELVKRGVKLTEIDYINDKSFDIRAVRILLRLFKKKKPDIVHTHAAMSARIAAKIYNKCKIVHTRHSVFEPPEKLKHFPLKQLSGILNDNLSDAIIAVSPAAAKNLTDVGTSPGKIKVIYNGVDKVRKLSDNEAANLRRSYGLSAENFIVSIAARLVDIKGHDYILDAAKIIAAKDEGVKFIIAGSGPMENHLKARASDESIGNVVFSGFIKDISRLISITDLQLNASYGTEATSLSLLEGMSAAVPAAVSDYGGNPFVITDGENGVVFPQKDAQAMADGILKIRNDRAFYKRLCKSAYETYRESFTSAIMTKDIIALYKELCRKGRSV